MGQAPYKEAGLTLMIGEPESVFDDLFGNLNELLDPRSDKCWLGSAFQACFLSKEGKDPVSQDDHMGKDLLGIAPNADDLLSFL